MKIQTYENWLISFSFFIFIFPKYYGATDFILLHLLSLLRRSSNTVAIITYLDTVRARWVVAHHIHETMLRTTHERTSTGGCARARHGKKNLTFLHRVAWRVLAFRNTRSDEMATKP